MEIKVIHNTKTELEVEIFDENETILNPITHKLSAIDDVDYAAYLSDHPHATSRRLFIRVKKGDPKKTLQKVIKELQTELSKFDKDVFTSKTKK